MFSFRDFFSAVALFRGAFGTYKLQVFVLTTLGFLSGIFEGLGATTLIPLFSFIVGEENGGEDFISQALQNFFPAIGFDFSLKTLLFFIATLFILKACVLLVGLYIQARIMSDYEKNTRTRLFYQILQTRWAYLLHQKIGYLEKTLTVEIQRVAGLLRYLGAIIIATTGLIVYFFIAINISPYITLVTVLVATALLFLLKPLLSVISRVSAKTIKTNKDIAHFVNQNIYGMKTVKAAAVTKQIGAFGEKQFEVLRKLRIKHALLGGIPISFFQPISIIFILLIFSFLYKTSDFNLPVFIAVVYLIQRIFTHIEQIQTHLQNIAKSTPFLQSMVDYENEARDFEEENKGKQKFEFNKELSFKNVSFAYNSEETNKNVLSAISFSIKKGEFVGLIGSSGSGKTTIVDLMLRLFEPISGSIVIDGNSVGDVRLKQWRKNIGYVSQDIYLMNDTIENNIKFYDPSISEEDMVTATKDAYIYETIKKLPQGFKSMVGERGVMLSAGQRQRIIIARALARKPKILIFDEATSALDNESESYIQKAIENLKGKITVLMIAHRLTTVLNCDKLLVLEGGRIVEQGNAKELLRDKESYFYKAYNIR